VSDPALATLTYRVPYADTDQMGVVYYANYLVYFERARTELLRLIGLPYREMERRGYGLPVIEAHVEYKSSAGYDDELSITGQLTWAKGVRLRVDCEVFLGKTMLCRGYTVHAFVDLQTMRPTRVIPELVKHSG